VHRLLSPEILRARLLIDQGAIGLPLMLDAELIVSGGLDGSTVERHELVCDPALSGGGELLNFGWYPVSAVRFLTGLEAIEVQAFGGALFDDRYAKHGVEDSVVASLKLANSVTATLMVARIAGVPGGLPASSTLRVIGSHGRLIADEDAPSSFVAESGQASARVRRIGRESSSAALQGFFQDFLAAVRDDRPAMMEIRDILANMATLDALAGSLSSGLCERVAGG
jgi:predicted dehydrogenase